MDSAEESDNSDADTKASSIATTQRVFAFDDDFTRRERREAAKAFEKIFNRKPKKDEIAMMRTTHNFLGAEVILWTTDHDTKVYDMEGQETGEYLGDTEDGDSCVVQLEQQLNSTVFNEVAQMNLAQYDKADITIEIDENGFFSREPLLSTRSVASSMWADNGSQYASSVYEEEEEEEMTPRRVAVPVPMFN